MMTPAPLKKPLSRSFWLYGCGLFLIILAAKLLLISHFGNATPYWDQWGGVGSAILVPSIENRLIPASLFDAHNEHRIFFSRVFVLGLFKLNGIWDPKAEMVTQALLHVSGIVLLIAVCTRFLATYSARFIFCLFAVAVFSIPFGYGNTLWGFQSQFYFVSLWGLIGIYCCWRSPTLSRGWWLGVFVLSLGLISMAGGFFAPAVTCGLLAVRAVQKRDEWRRQALGAVVLGTLVVVGFLLVNHVPGHDELKAHSLSQFFNALFLIISWPAEIRWLAPVFKAPLPLLLFWTMWQRRPAADPAWLLITLGLWCEAQAVAIAYGRAVGSNASRYTDNFSLALCVNLACLLYLALSLQSRFGKKTILPVIGWLIVVVGSVLHSAVVDLPAKVAKKHMQSRLQEMNVRAFVATDDFSKLQDKPRLHIPHHDAEYLTEVLRQPTLREILPTNLRAALVPEKVALSSAAGFRPNGYAPGTTRQPCQSHWGSYDPVAGNAARGSVQLDFPAGGRTSWLMLPMAGDPSAAGMSLTITDKAGHTHEIKPPGNSGESWRSVVFHRPEGPFTLRVIDENPSAWVAFTLPREIGPASLVADFLQDQALPIALLGLALVGISIWTDPARRPLPIP